MGAHRLYRLYRHGGGGDSLKAYDAVQLAAGLALQGTLTARHIRLSFVSRDDALLTAARAEGLSVDNPLWHTDVNL